MAWLQKAREQDHVATLCCKHGHSSHIQVYPSIIAQISKVTASGHLPCPPNLPNWHCLEDPYRDFVKRQLYERVAALEGPVRRIPDGPLEGRDFPVQAACTPAGLTCGAPWFWDVLGVHSDESLGVPGSHKESW